MSLAKQTPPDAEDSVIRIKAGRVTQLMDMLSKQAFTENPKREHHYGSENSRHDRR